ncbi:MAG TPA: DUF692 family protein [Bryobacteraceae bacterium]|nr:DUF692 family protein [Bryobacteraceae bacterium]
MDKLAIGVSLAEAVELCKRRLDGDPAHQSLGALNIGFLHSDEVPAELPELLKETGLAVVVHSVDLNLSTRLDEAKVDAIGAKLDLLDALWLEEDVGIWTWNEMFLGAHQLNPILDRRTRETTARNIRRCAQITGRPLMIENPPVYCIWGDEDLWHYLSDLAEQADCGIVMDVGHMIGYQIAAMADQSVPASWNGWRRVRELHFSGYETGEMDGLPVWWDRHDLPFGPGLLDWGAAAATAASASGGVMMSLEIEGAPADVAAANLAAIERIMGGLRNG